MKKLLFHLLIIVMTLCLIPQLSLARTGYVSDMLLLTFRQGPGNTYPVTKTLKSNTPVSILEEENGFYKVELQSKEIGWVDKKFIIFETPKTYIIDQLNQEKAALEAQISKFESASQQLSNKIATDQNDYSNRIQSLETDLKTALEEKSRLENLLSDSREKYTTLIEQSKNIQKIIRDNKELLEKNATLSTDLEVFRERNENLFKTGMIKWFLAGVGVLLLGWIIGKSVSSKKRRAGSLLD